MFWDKRWKGQIISYTIQQLTFKLTSNLLEVIITIVYARCKVLERLELWDNIKATAYSNQLPWVIGGDFNVILNKEET